jgi:uncharacterized NAD(P)/FAD-binding protein YdhS
MEGSPDDPSTIARRVPVVAIVGAGCTGTLLAANLLSGGEGAIEILLIERTGVFGRGVAYSTGDPQHLLNVAAARMSAWCDEPLDLCEWAGREIGEGARDAFIPRRDFGAYLQSVLADAEREAAPQRTLTRVSAEVLDARMDADGIELVLEGRAPISCDRLVLALGNLPAAPIAVLGQDPRIIPDPWAAGGVQAPPDGRTLVVGMGLTAVDTILSLTTGDDGATVLALSPSGRFPYAHLPGEHMPSPTPVIPAGPIELAEAEKLVRTHIARMESEGYDWRDAFDGLRPVTSELWSRLSLTDRREFLQRHVREWERRRHRMAPIVAERLAQLVATGRLTTLAARLTGLDASGPRLKVNIDLGGDRKSRELECDRIVVCAGTGTDIRKSPSRLLQSLLNSGRVVADDLGLGLRASSDGALLDDRGGEGDGRIFTLGPMRRGELWETTAVGEIRQQARDLAAVLDRSIAGERPAVRAALST